MEKPHTPNHSHGHSCLHPAAGESGTVTPRGPHPSRTRGSGQAGRPPARGPGRTRGWQERWLHRDAPRRHRSRCPASQRDQDPLRGSSGGEPPPRCLGTPRAPSQGGLERRRWHLVRGHPALPVPSSVEPLRVLNPESWGAAVVESDQYMLVFHVIDMII